MKVTIPQKPLLDACAQAERILPERGVGCTTTHALLTARDNSCTLHAVNPELTLCQQLPARVEEGGQAVLPARTTLALLRASQGEELVVEASSGGLLLRSPGARFQLDSPHPSLLPLPEPFPSGAVQYLAADQLQQTIQASLFAAGPGSRRYHLEAMLWEREANYLRLVATDNQRLAVAQMPIRSDDQSGSRVSHLLPTCGVSLLGRLAAQAKDEIEVVFSSDRAFFRVEGSTLSIRYAPGQYPSWRKAIPTNPTHRLRLPTAPFLAAVRQATVIRERQAARLLLRLEPGRLVLQSQQAGAGVARIARRVEFKGEPVQVAFNPRFLLEMLRCLEAEESLEMSLTDADTPVVFRAGGRYLHVLMPLRLPGL